jgi:hypothetical protein
MKKDASSKPRNRLERVVGGTAAALGLGLAIDLGLLDEQRVARIFDRLEPLARLGRLEQES